MTDEVKKDAWVRHWRSKGFNTFFVRLVPRGLIKVDEMDTFDTEAMVDLDSDGNVIGVTLSWQDSPKEEDEGNGRK